MDDMEEVRQRFEADVQDYVDQIEESVAAAQGFATANEEVKASLDGVRDKSLEAAAAMGIYRDEAGRWRDSAGRFAAAADLEAAGLGHVRDNAVEASAAMRELSSAQKSAGGAASGGGFGGLMPWLIGGGIIAALAGLPAILAAGGAAAGIALGAGLLIGTKQAQGPLYAQFRELTTGLLGIMRTAALPLVQPIALAFAQIGQWAQRIKPELTAVFGSLGPLVMPFTRGLEGLVSGVLPGFLRLMQSARPAMQAFANLLSQTGKGIGGLLGQLAAGVGPASKFLNGLTSAVVGLLPLVGTLSNTLATALAPVMGALGTQLIPQLAGSLSNTLIQLTPLLTALGQLTATLLPLLAQEIGPIAQGLNDVLGPVISGLTGLIDSLNGRVGTLIGNLNNLLKLASPLGLITNGLSGLGSAGPHAAQLLPGAGVFGQPQDVSGPIITSIAQATATYPYSNAWASGAYGGGTGYGSSGPSVAQQTAAYNIGQQITAALGSGVRETIPQARAAAQKLMAEIHRELAAGAVTAAQAASLINSVDTALASHIAATRALARKLGESLTTSLADSIASSNSASTMKTAISKLIADIKTAYDGGVITLSQDRYISEWLGAQAQRLETLAAQRAKVIAEITQAKSYAASTASSIAGNFTLSGFATSGMNGGAATVGQIVSGLRIDVGQIRKWAHNIHKLAKEGLNKSYLGQLIALGPVQGAAIAEELANANLGDIKAINSAEYQISEASGQVGKLAANAMYDSGVNAGKGFLSGLESQKKQITQLMESIAKAMIATLKKELGIASPATVPRWHALMVGEGIVAGLMDSIGRIKQAAALVAAAALPGGSRGLGATSGYAGSPSVHVNIPVNVQGGAGPAYQSPEFMQYMQRIVQEAVLRYGQMNPGNGLTPMWGH